MKAVNDLNFVMENLILMASLMIVSSSDNSPRYDIIFCFIGIIYFAILYLLFRYWILFTSEACAMNATVNDPDLHLQRFNDHGIFTMYQVNLLSKTMKPQ